MVSVTSRSGFLALVRKSGILDEKRFEEKHPDESELPESPSECAALLVKEGFLTPYQAKQLLAGKFKGFRLGTYKILQPLGQGGMGMVFLAEHLSLKRKVAVKVLPTDKAQENLSLERFQREARAAAALDHPNIVRLHDISQGAGVHFLVMEYVEGTDLQSFMAKSGALHFMQAVHYVAQAAAGLQHAHEKGFVHRDVKPGNLMLTKEGTIKILDMGLARSFVNEDDNLTGLLDEKAEIAGTVDFTSPEQASGNLVDERSDIYSLGITFFTLLTGQPPYRGTITQKLAQHQVADPPRLHKLKSGIPEALDDIIVKMIAKKPGDRYSSMQEVLEAIAPWLAPPTTGNIVQDPVSRSDMSALASTVKHFKNPTLGKVPKKLKNNHLLIGGIVGGILLVIGLVIVLGSKGSNRQNENNTSVKAPPTENKTNPTSNPISNPPLASGLRQISPNTVLGPTSNREKNNYLPISLESFVNISNSRLMFNPKYIDAYAPESWKDLSYRAIPFRLIEPVDGKNNLIQFYSANTELSNPQPKSIMIPVNASAAGLHFLSGVSGWGWPWNGTEEGTRGSLKGTICLTIRIHYDDDQIEEHEWKNGEHFVDFRGTNEAPKSEFVLCDRLNAQMRYLVIRPALPRVIKNVELVKNEEDFTAPLILAFTIEKLNQ